jgi:uncharacterized membrane protein YbhN (UPF0104 family)
MSLNASSALPLGVEPEQRRWAGWRLVKFFLAVVLTCLIVKGFAWRQIIEGLASVHFVYLIPVVLVVTPATIVLRSLRWRTLVVDGNLVSLSAYMRAYVVAFLANSLLFGKLGDLVKVKMIVRPGIGYAKSLASAVLDRLLEGMALVMVLGLSLIFAELPVWTKQLAVLVSVLCVASLVWLGFVFWKRDAIVTWVRLHFALAGSAIGSRILESVSRFLEGLEPLTHRRRVLTALGYSIMVWVLEIVAVMTFLKAFAIPAPHLLAAILILAALNFGTLVPISPGAIGVYQILCVFTLAVWHVNRELAFSFGLVMQAVLFIPVYLAGAATLMFQSGSGSLKTKLAQW